MLYYCFNLAKLSLVMQMIDYKVIGRRIKARRQEAHLTQELVAERVNITTVYLSKIENGHVRPTIDLLCAICLTLQCDIADILADASPVRDTYQNEQVVKLFNACSPTVKPIALNLLEQLAKLD